jgi:hypothetical protein
MGAQPTGDGHRADRGAGGDEGRQRAPYRERRTREVRAPAVASIGGATGYYAADPLWRARARLDRALGGPGMRGRAAGTPAEGAALDFWRVERVDPPRLLRLRAEMRMPGTAWLELAVEPVAEARSRLVQRTWFTPRGVAGHAFWWAELAGHKAVFARMCDGIARAAERGA